MVYTKMNHAAQLTAVLKKQLGEGPFIGVEIGTGAGVLTAHLLGSFPSLARLYTIDPWTHFPGEPFEAGHPQEYHCENMETARQRLRGFRKRVIICPCTSDKALEFIKKTMEGKPIDFVWIDGHHTEKQVRKDIENYAPLVRVGGIVGGHDYGLAPDVSKVVDEIYPSVCTGADFTWWIIKENENAKSD